jgi:hypothetical protein
VILPHQTVDLLNAVHLLVKHAGMSVGEALDSKVEHESPEYNAAMSYIVDAALNGDTDPYNASGILALAIQNALDDAA